MLKLGFFEEFKGTDSVLLTGSRHDIAFLSSRLEQFLASSEEMFPIHTMTCVSKRHPAALYASRSGRKDGAAYHWLCSPYEFETIQGKLELLASEGSRAHQYFALMQPATQLVVSVGEYDEEWWHEHG